MVVCSKAAVRLDAGHCKCFIDFIDYCVAMEILEKIFNDLVAMEIHDINQRSSVEAAGVLSNMALYVFQQCCVTSGVKRDARHVCTLELFIWLLISQKLKAAILVLQIANTAIRSVEINF